MATQQIILERHKPVDIATEVPTDLEAGTAYTVQIVEGQVAALALLSSAPTEAQIRDWDPAAARHLIHTPPSSGTDSYRAVIPSEDAIYAWGQSGVCIISITEEE